MSVRRTVVTRYPTPATRGSEDPQANPVTSRETMQAARRVVVKIGSSSLTTPDGLDVAAIDRLVPRVEIVQVQHGQAVRRLARRQPDQRQGAQRPEQQTTGQHHARRIARTGMPLAPHSR